MEFIVTRGTLLTELQKLVILEAIKAKMDISFEDASFEIDNYDTMVVIHEEVKNEVV